MSINRPNSPISVQPEQKDLSSSVSSLSDSYVVVNSHYDPEEQKQRDIDLVTAAIERPGDGESAHSAKVLQNIYTLLSRGGLQYYKEDKEEKGSGDWRPWELPFASALCHGSRVLIQFPEELNQQILDWLFEGKKYERAAATHGVQEIPPKPEEAEEKPEKVTERLDKIGKQLKEKKVSFLGAAMQAVSLYAAYFSEYIPVVGPELAKQLYPVGKHFGVDLALGGAGTISRFSPTTRIDNNGENGHLYLYYEPGANGKPGGLLVGIEQSAPGKKDQHGGSHSIWGTNKPQSATDGQNYAAENQMKGHGPSRYYDSIFLNLTSKKFAEISKLPFSNDMLGYPPPIKLSQESKESELLPPSPVSSPEPIISSDSDSETDELKPVSLHLLSSEGEQKKNSFATVNIDLDLQVEYEPRDESEELEEYESDEEEQKEWPVSLLAASPPAAKPKLVVNWLPEPEDKITEMTQPLSGYSVGYKHVINATDYDDEEAEEKQPVIDNDPATPTTPISDSTFSVGDLSLSEDNSLEEVPQRRASRNTPGWKIAAAVIGCLLGIAAIVTGVGALVGVSILAGIAVWAAASIVTVGGVTALSSTAYICSSALCAGKSKQDIDYIDVNKKPAPLQMRTDSPSPFLLASKRGFFAQDKMPSEEQARENARSEELPRYPY